MTLRVTAVALIGYEHDYLAKILTDWLEEGFQEEGAAVDFARAMLEKLEESVYQRPP